MSECYSRPTLYYTAHPDKPDYNLEACLDRAKELGISYIVTASASGSTALRAVEMIEERGLKDMHVVCVSNPISWNKHGVSPIKEEMLAKLEAKGVKVVQGSRPFNGLDFAFQKKWGGVTLGTAILEAYLRFSEGVFHALQVATMAADAGLVPLDEDIICEALYDTSLVVRIGNLNNFFDTNVKEVISMATYPTTALSWE
jgi:hypothetical protein